MLAFSSKAQVFSEFEHSSSILSHLNPAATGVDSTLNFTTTFRNFENIASSQIAMVEGFSNRFNGGFSLQYFGQEMELARFRNVRGSYAFHMDYKGFKAQYGAGLSVTSRSPRGVSTSPFFSQSDPDSVANFFRLHIGAMLFHKNLELGFAYHPFLGQEEDLKLAHSTPFIGHFGFYHKFNDVALVRPYVVVSVDPNLSGWRLNMPVQYRWLRAGVSVSSKNGTGYMVGVNRHFLSISYYYNAQPTQQVSTLSPSSLHEVVFSISFRNAKRFDANMRRGALM